MDRAEELQKWRNESGYTSVDPAPPLVAPNEPAEVTELRQRLLDTNLAMFQRMRAVFALRNIGGEAAIDALGAAFADSSALLRHELAYVMGQMGDPHALRHLEPRLRDPQEHVMVRHEAAEAMGAIGEESARPCLEEFKDDEHPEVAESCVVALDLLDWMRGDQMDY